MQADGGLESAHKRRYKNVFDGIIKIVRTEGISQLWRGCGPMIVRSTLITSVQLTTYDMVKRFLVSHYNFHEERVSTYILSSIVTAFAASLVTSPVDVVKTRMMNKQVLYSSAIDCTWKTLKYEGPFGFYKGFLPTFMRLTPHNIILWVTMENVQQALSRYA
eukprot:TRINITY_DN2782_c0_g1_i1.p2 TRINITY_DN2782_c0_g1~~TRINITY_DN2782_c0_g1_i1.p2  ORF type:complete len:162 (-),score=11.16 TRINITY_DN2782_c0_g1_i1:89-574(-)